VTHGDGRRRLLVSLMRDCRTAERAAKEKVQSAEERATLAEQRAARAESRAARSEELFQALGKMVQQLASMQAKSEADRAAVTRARRARLDQLVLHARAIDVDLNALTPDLFVPLDDD